MKNMLIKIISILSIVIILATVFIFPASAQVNQALTVGLTLKWDEDIDNPFTIDTLQTYNFGFYDARGYYCTGIVLSYRPSDGFIIQYLYDDVATVGYQDVYNDGTGRDDRFFTPYARYITLVSVPTDPAIVSFLQAYTSISEGATYSEGYQNGYNSGLAIGLSQGYDQGFRDGQDATASQNFGQNLLGSTLAVPINALNDFVLFTAPNGMDVTLGGVVGAIIGLSLFVLFLKIFAGG